MTGDGAGSQGGTYTLLLAVTEAARIQVGALGERWFPAGYYAYTGSALGPGGFARVERHRDVAADERDARHWHVDYLLGHDAASLVDATLSPGFDAECAVAARVEGDPVQGFGASDCACATHLVHAAERDALVAAVETAHRSVQDGD